MVERAHLSIGEVLSLLREEFPDVTISKIRFLESQGLLDPERTPSGYRKFYEEDVERLRWILRQQRENFLPLKVIKGRLVDHPDVPADGGAPAQAANATRATSPLSMAAMVVPPASTGSTASGSIPSGSAKSGSAVSPSGSSGAASSGPAASGAAASGLASSGPAASRLASSGPAASGLASSGLDPGPSGGNYTLDELAAATGLSEDAINELSRFGMIASRDIGGTAYYDEEAATVAALAAGFARHGVEARHLRMYKNAAERESALFEQIVMPLVKQRNPQARQQAASALEDLGRLSAELRRALLRQALGNAF